MVVCYGEYGVFCVYISALIVCSLFGFCARFLPCFVEGSQSCRIRSLMTPNLAVLCHLYGHSLANSAFILQLYAGYQSLVVLQKLMGLIMSL